MILSTLVGIDIVLIWTENLLCISFVTKINLLTIFLDKKH